MIEEAQAVSSEHGDSIPETDSLYDFFIKKSHELFPDSQEDRELLCQMSQMWGAYIGDSVQRQSLRFAWMEEVCGGGELVLYCCREIR